MVQLPHVSAEIDSSDAKEKVVESIWEELRKGEYYRQDFVSCLIIGFTCFDLVKLTNYKLSLFL